ncbi:Rpn family recombination-promoting nuclease/putative transposase [Orientia tsutsugamushi]|nr:Rpn family recombination-promoting nuclease/putative transposase [Orientia tsutsugamushi]KJV73372.1 putative permease [Orientia tsutsugamushi str. TA716]
MSENLKHDGLFKDLMNDPKAALDFTNDFLPNEVKNILDLSTIKVEQESFVEANLCRSMCDVLFSVKTKNNNDAFIYVLIEAELRSDYWIAFKLWQYTLSILKRHKKGLKKRTKERGKLPIVVPIVVYHGSERFNAPRTLWELFDDPKLAKKLMGSEYLLIDWQAMPDSEIKRKATAALVHFMKYIHNQPDIIELWAKFFDTLQEIAQKDKENGFLYIKALLHYTISKVSKNEQPRLKQLLDENLSIEDRKRIMGTIAAQYIDEGIAKGRAEGIEIGETKGRAEGIAEGIAKGRAEAAQELARNLLKAGFSVEFISENTGLSKEEVINLKNNIEY